VKKEIENINLLNIIVQKFPILQYQLKSDSERFTPFLRASAKLQNTTINFILSVHPPVHMEQLGSH